MRTNNLWVNKWWIHIWKWEKIRSSETSNGIQFKVLPAFMFAWEKKILKKERIYEKSSVESFTCFDVRLGEKNSKKERI